MPSDKTNNREPGIKRHANLFSQPISLREALLVCVPCQVSNYQNKSKYRNRKQRRYHKQQVRESYVFSCFLYNNLHSKKKEISLSTYIDNAIVG